MPRRPMREEERSFMREVFEWIRTVGVREGYFKENWKEDLVTYIWEEMKREGKEVKKESVRRNLNRMIAYYYNTGAQARSGRVYLEYIRRLFESFNEMTISEGGLIAKEFLMVEDAINLGYINLEERLTFLRCIPHFRSLTIVAYRMPFS